MLGTNGHFPYCQLVIGFLRLIGVLNAALWLGGAVFFTLAAGPAFFSPDMEKLLEARNYPYFSVAIEQIIVARYFQFQIACALVALLHLLAEWFYLGRPARTFSFSVIAALLALVLIGGNLVQPRLKQLHATAYALKVPPAGRAAAAASFRAWSNFSELLNFVVIGGLVVYLWRVTNHSDSMRFSSSVKCRG
jgi:hypothetical protein